jgi:large subunit GTPase 1
MDAAVAEHGHLMRIPRRPAWTRDMPAEELQLREKETFLEWRRQLAILQVLEKKSEGDHFI